MARNMSSCALGEAFASSEFKSLVSPETDVLMSVDQAISCLRQMFQVEYERWSIKDGKNPSMPNFSQHESLREPTSKSPPGLTITPTLALAAIDQSVNKSFESPDAQGPRVVPGAKTIEFAKDAMTSTREEHQCKMAIEAAADHQHCMPMRSGSRDLGEMRHLSEDERKEYEAKTTQEQKKMIQKNLARLGACNYGCGWVRVSGGFRCSDYVCFISDSQVFG
jgi:hypothetical protein